MKSGLLYDRHPDLHVVGDELCEILRRAAERLEADPRDRRCNVGSLQAFVDPGIDNAGSTRM
jgi:hypothetical protein